MSSQQLEWVVVKAGVKPKPIGAIAFYQKKAAIITSCFDEKDSNRDGSVSTFEWAVGLMSPLNLKNSALADVALAAAKDYEILERDPSFQVDGERFWLSFTRGLATDAVYFTWFRRCVQQTASIAATVATTNLVKQYVIRKGMEKSIRLLYDRQTRS